MKMRTGVAWKSAARCVRLAERIASIQPELSKVSAHNVSLSLFGYAAEWFRRSSGMKGNPLTPAKFYSTTYAVAGLTNSSRGWHGIQAQSLIGSVQIDLRPTRPTKNSHVSRGKAESYASDALPTHEPLNECLQQEA